MTPHHTSFLRRFAADTRGSILMIFGLVFVVLVGIAGAGYDLGMRELLRAHTQRAADFAATSAGGVEGSVTGMTDKQMREATALRYFNLNFGDSFLGEARPPLSLGNGPNSIDVTSSTITVQADGIMPTKFVKNLGPGHDTLKADAYSQVAFTPINKPGGDVILLIDTSLSMRNNLAGTAPLIAGIPTAPLADQRITILKASATGFINALLTQANSTLPAAQQNRVSIMAWNSTPAMSLSPLPFTSNKTVALAHLNSITLFGGTRSDNALSRVLRDYTMDPVTYFNPGAARIVVLLTDGEQDGCQLFDPVTYANRIKGVTAIGACWPSMGCNPMKPAPPPMNAIIYTIAFGAGASTPRAQHLLSSSATDGVGIGYFGPYLKPCNPNAGSYVNAPIDPINNENTYFFSAANASQLDQVFASIGNSIKKIRIVQ